MAKKRTTPSEPPAKPKSTLKSGNALLARIERLQAEGINPLERRIIGRLPPDIASGMPEEDLIAELTKRAQDELQLETRPKDQCPAYDDVLAKVQSLFAVIVDRENWVYTRSLKQQIISKVVASLMGGDPPD